MCCNRSRKTGLFFSKKLTTNFTSIWRHLAEIPCNMVTSKLMVQSYIFISLRGLLIKNHLPHLNRTFYSDGFPTLYRIEDSTRHTKHSMDVSVRSLIWSNFNEYCKRRNSPETNILFALKSETTQQLSNNNNTSALSKQHLQERSRKSTFMRHLIIFQIPSTLPF